MAAGAGGGGASPVFQTPPPAAGAAAGAAAAAPEARWGELVAEDPRAVRHGAAEFAVASIPLTRTPFSIGRLPTCDHAVANPAVSGRHCVLRHCAAPDGGGAAAAAVIDDVSTNGIWVRGRRLGRGNSEHILDGDEIVLVRGGRAAAALSMRYHFRDAPTFELTADSAGSPAPAEPVTAPAPRREVSALYNLGEVIGKGGYSDVRAAEHRITGRAVAVKAVHRRRAAVAAGVAPAPPRTAEAARRAELREMREVAILRRVRHPSLVSVVDVFSDEDALHLVLELARGGDLYTHIKGNGVLPEPDARVVMRQLCSAVRYLHEECRVAHRDIKPENVLLAEPGRLDQVRLTDFGLAIVFDAAVGDAAAAAGDAAAAPGPALMQTVCGTPLYVAPEVVERRAAPAPGRAPAAGYSAQCDMWSLGVLLYVMLTASAPFAKRTDAYGRPQRCVDYSRAPEWARLPALPADASALLRGMLSTDPGARPSAAAACAAAWLAAGAEEEAEEGDVECSSALSSAAQQQGSPPPAKRQRQCVGQ